MSDLGSDCANYLRVSRRAAVSSPLQLLGTHTPIVSAGPEGENKVAYVN